MRTKFYLWVILAILAILSTAVTKTWALQASQSSGLEVVRNDRVFRYVGAADKGKIVFPGDDNEVHKLPADIPEQILIQMKDMTDPSKFLNTLVYETGKTAPSGGDQVSLSYLQRGYDNVESTSGSPNGATQLSPNPAAPKKPLRMPKISSPAGCAVELRTVELEEPKDNEMFYPWCVRLPRCSGCCPSTRLECVPTNVSYIDVTALRLHYVKFDQKFKFEGLKVFKMMKHESCQCQCIQQPEDCSRSQVYKPEECRCVCGNTKAADECQATHYKVWNKDNCSCSCRHRLPCSTGLNFNEETCRCELTERVQVTTRTTSKDFKKANNTKWRLQNVTEAPSVVKADTDGELSKQKMSNSNVSAAVGFTPEITTRAGRRR